MSPLLANLKYQDKHPTAIVTDLGKNWYIMWLDGRTIRCYRSKFTEDAVDYLEHFLKSPSTVIERFGLDVIFNAKPQKLSLVTDDRQPSQANMSLKVDGLLSCQEEKYFLVNMLVSARHALPAFRYFFDSRWNYLLLSIHHSCTYKIFYSCIPLAKGL